MSFLFNCLRAPLALGGVLLAGLLLGGCTYNGEEPELYRQAPLLTVQAPAIITDDTLVLGRNQSLALNGYAYLATDFSPADLSMYVSEDGAARRRVAQKAGIGLSSAFSLSWQPTTTVRRNEVTVELIDKANQLESRHFWVRTTTLTTPTLSFPAAQQPPGKVAAGASVQLRVLINSPDPPTELRLYYYASQSPGGFRLEPLAMLDAAAIAAAPITPGTYLVTLPAYAIPATAEAGSQYSVLLHLRTQHHLQAQLYYNPTVN